MLKSNESFITGEMLIKYYELNKQKKEIELEMNNLKDMFQEYFNQLIGEERKGEIIVNGYKLQRQIRKTEKYKDEETVKMLEDLKLNDLIQVIKKPDEQKIKAALNLGLLNAEQLDSCITTTYSPAITVKPLTPR
ncbi:hypothetical protein [Neobacillus mesonae]|uniref:hypothetical protein n=1 Tax=Neobacillus mesonae TaxID=1193713 RepID=UPI0025726B87|nr:hypothetical protein [Neobacillus mesonae]MED4206481.1 hypothetical protein [Neobacillus mesonae]